MRSYKIFYEIGPDGECLAHALDLPGCVIRGQSQSEVIANLPEAIQNHLAWLERHGEQVGEKSSLELLMGGTSLGAGPFRRGDTAALIVDDLVPLTVVEMDNTYFRRSGYARKDLLILVGSLDENALDWRKEEGEMTIREILRHIGNAEEWYLSRLVAVESLPNEWDHDEEMPVLEFLEMVRRTSIERFRQLTKAELSGITRPEHWTRHPEERWTVRKALRRMLEHELEHISHIRQVLDAFRFQEGLR